MSKTGKEVESGRCRCEMDSGYSLLIIRIDNPTRLNSDVTEDFILVPNEQYVKAVRVLSVADVEEMPCTISGVTSLLTSAEVKFDHIINGHRFFFSDGDNEDEGCSCGQDD